MSLDLERCGKIQKNITADIRAVTSYRSAPLKIISLGAAYITINESVSEMIMKKINKRMERILDEIKEELQAEEREHLERMQEDIKNRLI